MHIIFLLTQDLESPSGLGRYFPLANELAALGYTTEIFALHSNYPMLQSHEFILNRVKIHYIAQMHVRKYSNKKVYFHLLQLICLSIRATLRFTKIALSTSYEIIQICKPHPMNGIAGILAKFIRKKVVFLDIDDYEAASGNFRYRWQRWLIDAFEKCLPRIVDVVTTNTYYMRDKLISWGIPPEKIHYLPNGVDMQRFQKASREEVISLKEKLGFRDKKVVSYIGSLSLVSHAIDLLIHAFKTVYTQFPNARLLIVGGGEDLPKLELLARQLGLGEVVIFTGRIHPMGVALYYQISDVVIDPVYDNDAARGRAPLKLFESWASGTPFVSGDVGDRRQLLGDPPAGLLAKPGDVHSLAEQIILLFTRHGLSETLSQLGQERVKHFYWERIAQDLVQIYLDYT